MTKAFVLFFLITCFGCNLNNIKPSVTISNSQQRIDSLLTECQSEYDKLYGIREMSIISDYSEKLDSLISLDLSGKLDNFSVRVDSVKWIGLKSSTSFSSKGINIFFSLQFAEHMSSKMDSLYSFFRNFRKGQTIHADFVYISSKVSVNESRKCRFDIIASPQPVGF
jgi:hypothetical protein